MLPVFTGKSKNNPEKGATVVEFSVIAALLFVFLFGIIEYAMIFMQEHYVANAAREAVRIGVRANNYNTYKKKALPNAGTVTVVADRDVVVKNAVVNYLDIFYDATEVRNGTSLLTKDLDGNLTTEKDRTLTVTVTVKNIFTSITPGLLQMLSPGSGGIAGPQFIGFSASMELEDPDEFDPANL